MAHNLTYEVISILSGKVPAQNSGPITISISVTKSKLAQATSIGIR
jgi:hypothetical protein